MSSQVEDIMKALEAIRTINSAELEMLKRAVTKKSHDAQEVIDRAIATEDEDNCDINTEVDVVEFYGEVFCWLEG